MEGRRQVAVVGKVVPLRKGALPVKAAVAAFKSSRESEEVSRHTLAAYDAGLSVFTQFCDAQGIGGTDELTREHIEAFSVWLQKIYRRRIYRRDLGQTVATKQALGLESRIDYLTRVGSFLKWLHERAYMTEAIPVPRPRHDRNIIHTPTQAEVNRAIAVWDAHHRPSGDYYRGDRWPFMAKRNTALLKMAFNLGARLDELLKMSGSDFNFSTRQVRLNGKGRKQRSLSYNLSTARSLAAYLDERSARFGVARNDPGPLWYGFDRNEDQTGAHPKPLDRAAVRSVFRATERMSGVGGLHPHIARHWCAANMLKRGVPTAYVREWLGHESLTTTDRYAGRLGVNDLQGMSDRLFSDIFSD
jgi:site-specific recombinase XerD